MGMPTIGIHIIKTPINMIPTALHLAFLLGLFPHSGHLEASVLMGLSHASHEPVSCTMLSSTKQRYLKHE